MKIAFLTSHKVKKHYEITSLTLNFIDSYLSSVKIQRQLIFDEVELVNMDKLFNLAIFKDCHWKLGVRDAVWINYKVNSHPI